MDDLYAVTPEELVRYRDFCGSAFPQFGRKAPDTLWYYTSGATFARIIETGTVWSTQISCLNDHTEFRHAIHLLREAIEPYRANEHDGDTRWIANHVYEGLADDGAEGSWFFVFCMTEAKDDLSQWRAYSEGENGVSIGFHVPLPRPRITNDPYLMPVTYLDERKTALAGDIAKWTVNFFKIGLAKRPDADREKWARSFLAAWVNEIIYFVPLLKDKAFKDEREWRLIIRLNQEDTKNIKIQQRKSLISRHLPLSFGDKLPIKHVVVGPCRHPVVSRISVGTFLSANGYEVTDPASSTGTDVIVESSSVPYQTT